MAIESSEFPSSRFLGSLVQTINEQIRSWIEEENIPIPVIAATLQRIIGGAVDERLNRDIEEVMDNQDGSILQGMFNNPTCFCQADFSAKPEMRAVREERIRVAKQCFADLLNYWINVVFKVDNFNIRHAYVNANNLFRREFEQLSLAPIPEAAPSQAEALLNKAKYAKAQSDYQVAFETFNGYLRLVEKEGLTLELYRKTLRFFSHFTNLTSCTFADIRAFREEATQWLERFKTSAFAREHTVHTHVFTLNNLLNFAYYAFQVKDRLSGADRDSCQALIDDSIREILAYVERHRAEIPPAILKKSHLLLGLMLPHYSSESALQQKILAQEVLRQELLEEYNRGSSEKIVVAIKKIEELARMEQGEISAYFDQQTEILPHLRHDYSLLLSLLNKLTDKSIGFERLNIEESLMVVESLREGMEDRNPNKETLKGVISKLHSGIALTDEERTKIDAVFASRNGLLRALRIYGIRTRLQAAVENFALEDFIQIATHLEKWYYTQPDQMTFNLATRGATLTQLVRFCVYILNQPETNPALPECRRFLNERGVPGLSELLTLFLTRYVAEQISVPGFRHRDIFSDRNEFKLLMRAWLRFNNIDSETPLHRLTVNQLSMLVLFQNEQLETEGYDQDSILRVAKLCEEIASRSEIPHDHPLIKQVQKLFSIPQLKKLYVLDWDDTLVDQATDARTGKKLPLHVMTQVRLFKHLLANPNASIAILSSGSEAAEIKEALTGLLGEQAVSRIKIFGNDYFRGEAFRKRYEDSCRALPAEAARPNPKVFAVKNDPQFQQLRRGISDENVVVLDDAAGTIVEMCENSYTGLLALPLSDDKYLCSVAFADGELSANLLRVCQGMVSPDKARAEMDALRDSAKDIYAQFMASQMEMANSILHLADKYRRKIEKETRPNAKHYLLYQCAKFAYEKAISMMMINAPLTMDNMLRAYLNLAELERKICRLQYGLSEGERINMGDHYANRVRHVLSIAALLRSGVASDAQASHVRLLLRDIQTLVSEVCDELRSAAALPVERLPGKIQEIMKEQSLASVQDLIRSLQRIPQTLQPNLTVVEPAAAAAASSGMLGGLLRFANR